VMVFGGTLFVIRYLALWYYRKIDPALAWIKYIFLIDEYNPAMHEQNRTWKNHRNNGIGRIDVHCSTCQGNGFELPALVSREVHILCE
jgi:hypothetical protein